MAVFKLSGRHTMATLPTEDEMKPDEDEYLMLAAALLGAILGTVMGALFFLFIGV
jgi:preprotein translocase subunit Sss1